LTFHIFSILRTITRRLPLNKSTDENKKVKEHDKNTILTIDSIKKKKCRLQSYVPSNCTTFEVLAPKETMLSKTLGASLSQQVMPRKDIATTYNYLLY